MKTKISILAICLIFVISCETKNKSYLKEAEEYLKENPDTSQYTIMRDSALIILDNVDYKNLSKDNKTRIDILKALAKYKLYEPYYLSPIDSCREQLISISKDDPSMLYRYLFLKAFLLFECAKYPEAMKYAMKGFQLSKKYNDHYWTAKNSQIVGDILCKNFNWSGALQQDSITIKEYQKAGRFRDAYFAKVDYAINLSSSGKIQDAHKNFLKINEIGSATKDSALLSYNTTMHIFCLIDYGRLIDAKRLIEKSKNFNNRVGFQSQYYNALFEISLLENKMQKAEAYLDSIEKDDDEGIGEVRYLDAKSKYLKKKGDYKQALEVTDSIILLSNKMIKVLLTQSVVAAQRDFYDEMAQEEALEAKRNRMIILFVSIGAIFVIILGWLYFRYRLKLKNLEIQNKINKIYNLSQDLDQLSSEKIGLLESVHNQEDQLNKITSELKLNLNNIEKMKEEIQHKEAELLTLSESLNSLSEESDDQYDSEALRQELEKLQIKEKENSRKIRELFKSRLEFFNKFSNIYLTKKDSPRVKKSLIEDFENMLTEMKKGIKAGQVEQQVNHFLNDIIAELREKCDTLSEEDLLVTSLIYAGYMPRYISEVCGYSSKYFYVKRTRIIEKILKSMPEQDASQYIEMIKKV